jgi:O-antigen/teichoic acid export membrane protein
MNVADQHADRTESGATTGAPAYGRVVARGMAWTSLAVLVSRVTGFVAQLILGWLLSEDDFGTYAIAIALSVVILTLRSSGAQKLLIQRGSEYNQLAQPLAILSLGINLVAMLVLWLAAPIAAAYYAAPAIIPLMWVIGLSMPLAVPSDILRSRLSIDLRFRDLAILNAGTLILTQLLIVILALAGMGPMSFVIPLVVVAIVEWAVLWRMVGCWPAGRRLNWHLWLELFASAKWIVLTGFASALIVQGNHLVVGKLEPRDVTGVVFFGFQLTTAVALFFNTGMQRVLMPTLTRLSDQPNRQGQAYLKLLRVLVAGAAPVCLWAVLVAQPAIHLLWAGKWDRATPVVELLGGVLPIYMLTAISASVLEARGYWRPNTFLHFASGLGTVLTAWAGATLGGIWEIALAAASFRLAFGLLQGSVVAGMIGLPARSFLAAILPPYLAAIAIAGCVRAIAAGLVPHAAPPLLIAGISVSYLLLTCVVYQFAFAGRVRELMETLGVLRPAPHGS